MQQNKKLQAHRLNHQELRDLQYAQMNDEAETIKGNKNSDFDIPAVEKHLIHANIELKSFNSATGEKTSVARLQSFYPKDFERMEKEGAFKGYSVEIVHQPSDKVEPAVEDKGNLAQGAFVDENSKKIAEQLANGQSVGGPIGGVLNIDPNIKLPETGTSGSGDVKESKEDLEKRLKKLDKAGVQAEYKKSWSEDADSSLTVAELTEAILSKYDEAGTSGSGE